MKSVKSTAKLLSAMLSMAFASSASVQASTVVFSEDFSTSTLANNPNGYLGGFYTPQVAFGQWVGSNDGVSITTGVMTAAPTSATRTGGIVLSPSLFAEAGPGTYTLTFDITSYSGSSNNNALVSVWSGAGYDLSLSSSSSLIVDTYAAQFTPSGSATASLLASGTYTSAGNA